MVKVMNGHVTTTKQCNDVTSCIESAISELQTKRPIFHSEADFQLALACELKEVFKKANVNYEVRLEKPEKLVMEYHKNAVSQPKATKATNASFDIVIVDDKDNLYPIELKYKTKKLDVKYGGEIYNLSGQGDTNLGRYSFRKDICRLEKYLQKYKTDDNIVKGYFIAIVNDLDYVSKNVRITNKGDQKYSFHCGAKLENNAFWTSGKSWQKKSNLMYELNLEGDYTIEWQPYSKLECSKNLKDSQFCYTMVEVNTPSEGAKPDVNTFTCDVTTADPLKECPCPDKSETKCD